MTLDVGSNLTALGFAFLALKYLLPVFIGIIMLVLLFFAVSFLIEQLELDINPSDIFKNQYFWIFAILVLLILVVR